MSYDNFTQSIIDNDLELTTTTLFNNKNIWKSINFENKISIQYINSSLYNNILYDILYNKEDDEIEEESKEEESKEEDKDEEDKIKVEEDKDEEDKIKKYSIEDFENIVYITKGLYGEIYSANFKINKKQCILKKYITKENNDDFIRELTYIEIINKKYPNTCCNIYGYINNNYIVIERLLFSLEDIYKIITPLDIISKEKLLSNWIRIILNKLDNINKLGFIHNDLKSSNIMFDSECNIKLIDFGVAEFLGFGQSKKLYNTYISSMYIKAPDNGTFKSVIYTLNNNKYNIYEINRKNYSSDIYSLGSIILEGLNYNKVAKKYTFINNILHYTYDNKIWTIEDSKNNFYLLSINFQNEIKQLMAQNSLYRMYNNISNLQLQTTNIYYLNTNNNNIYKYLNNIYYYYNSSELINNFHELKYNKDIVNNYKNETIVNVYNTIEDIFEDIIYLYMYKNPIELDIIFNTLIMKITYSNIDYREYINIYKALFEYNTNIIKIDISYKIKFIPIMIYINYFIIILQKNNIEKSDIINIKISIISIFLKWLIYNNDKKEYIVFDIIENIVYILLQTKNIIINYNININENIIKIIDYLSTIKVKQNFESFFINNINS